jgi:hypothetical protein
MIERIGARRGELADRADLLRKELGEIEAELADLAGRDRCAAVAGGVIPRQGVDSCPATVRGCGSSLLTAPGPVSCEDVCRKLGLAFEPRLIEGVRVKLKRLVARRWLTEPSPGRFTGAAPAVLIAEA